MERWVRPGVSGEVESVVRGRVKRVRDRRGRERAPRAGENSFRILQKECMHMATNNVSKESDDYKYLNLM